MADETRHSQALEAEIITDPMDKARKESFNVVEQFRADGSLRLETDLVPRRWRDGGCRSKQSAAPNRAPGTTWPAASSREASDRNLCR